MQLRYIYLLLTVCIVFICFSRQFGLRDLEKAVCSIEQQRDGSQSEGTAAVVQDAVRWLS